jgi:hypothetical protein
MQKWEYLSAYLSLSFEHRGLTIAASNDQILRDKPKLDDWLKKLGEQGWELVGHTATGSYLTCIFKRPL